MFSGPDVAPPTHPAEVVRRPPRWRGAVRLVVLAGFLGALGWALAAQWESVRPLLGQLSVPSLAAALTAVAAGILATFLCWQAVLAGLGGRLPAAVGAGLAVAAVTAPLLGQDALHAYWWLLAVLPLAC